jgi:hypothetical protein
VKTGTLMLALLVAAAPVAASTDAPADLAERSETVAEARGLTALTVDNSRGRVHVGPSDDGRIHVRATRIARMGTEKDARRYLAETTVSCAPRNGQYVVEVRYPHRIDVNFRFQDLFTRSGRDRMRFPSLEVVLEISVPATLPVSVRTVSGDVAARGLAADMQVETTSGDIGIAALRANADVTSVSGDVTLEQVGRARARTTSGDVNVHGAGSLDCGTVSGDVTADGVRAALEFKSESGDLEVDGAPAGIRARSTSGGLSVRDAAGDVALSTVSGSIEARFARALRAAELSSTSGGIEADLASGLGVNLAASTTSGSMDCRAPMTLLRHDAHHLEGRVGSGGPAIRIQTVSGDLTVTSGGM